MKSIFIVLFMLLTSTIGMDAQERFARIYDDDDWLASLITNVIPEDGGYLVSGIFVNETPIGDGFFVYDVNGMGDITNTKILFDTLRNINMFHPNMAYNVDYSMYQIYGYQNDSAGQHVILLNWFNGTWPPTTKVFNELDIGTADHQSSDYFTDSKYLFGTSTVFGFEGRQEQDVYLFKYDMELDKIIWERSIGDSRWREIRPFLHPVSDSTFLIGFNRNDHHLTDNHFDYRMAIWKMDTSGQILDQFELDIPNRLPGWPTDMVSTPDGGFIITGNIKTETNFDAGSLASDGYIFKLDENLTYVWSTEVKGDRLSGVSRMSKIIAVDNNYMVSGHIIKFDSTATTWSESLTVMTKIDRNGNILWQQYFNFVEDATAANEDQFNYDMRQTSDGGFILSGSFQDFKIGNNGKQRGYLIKVDSDGCLIPNCGINATDDPDHNTVGLVLYPNPTSDFLAFQINSNLTGTWQGQIVDVSGRRILTLQSLRSDVQHLVAVDNWVRGVYFLELHNQSEASKRKKFVVK